MLEENGNRKNAFESSSGVKRLPAVKARSGEQEFQLLLFEPNKKGSSQSNNRVLDQIAKIDLDLAHPPTGPCQAGRTEETALRDRRDNRDLKKVIV